MKFERLSLVLLLSGAFMLQPVLAEGDGNPLKIGYVDIQAIAAKSPKLAEDVNRLEKEIGARKKAIRDKDVALSQLKERHQKEGRTMKREELKKLEDQILKQERELRFESSIIDDDYKRQYNQLVSDFEQEVLKAILVIVKEEHYDLILKDGVLINSPRVSLTDRVLSQLTANAQAKKK